MWTADGELVDAAGKVHRAGRRSKPPTPSSSRRHPNEKIDVAIDSMRMLERRCRDRRRTRFARRREDRCSGQYSAIHVKQDGKWLMASVHESSEPGSMAAANLQDLDWLVGKWTGEERGARPTVDCRWLPNKTFSRTQVRGDRGRRHDDDRAYN